MALVHACDADHGHGLCMAGLVRVWPDGHERRLYVQTRQEQPRGLLED
jgi:hypothetical protein